MRYVQALNNQQLPKEEQWKRKQDIKQSVATQIGNSNLLTID